MKTNWKRVDMLVDSSVKAGLQGIGNDVKKRSIILAPVLTGALRRSARVHMSSEGDTVTVSFNTPYSRLRHYQNRKHPATRYYLANALKSIKDVGRYFKKFN